MDAARRGAAVALAALIAIAPLAACTPDPAPTPTPTGFASEEEAFAAAEATYRAYVDAVNSVDLADPESFESVFDTLMGDALNATKKSFSQMHADGWVVGGTSTIALVEPSLTTAETVTLAICLDVSDVTLTDEAGLSQVGNRPAEQSLSALVVESGGEWLIAEFSGREGSPECTA